MALTKGHTFTSGEIVTPTKLNNLVDDATIDDNAITTAKIADDAITAAKIADGAVLAAHLDSAAVGASAIDDLTDVDTSTAAPTDGQSLVWDNAASKWEPGTVSGGSGSTTSYDTGWVLTDGTTTVANGATLTFSHGLSSSALIVAIYVSASSDGSYARSINDVSDPGGDVNIYGGAVTNITSTQVRLQLAGAGYSSFNGSGENYNSSTVDGHNADSGGTVPFTDKYIKLVAIKGGTSSSSGSASAFVAFDGTASSITPSSSSNVSSVTKNGTGDYTVNFTNSITNPIVSANALKADATNTYDVSIYSVSSTAVRLVTGTNTSGLIDMGVHMVVHTGS